MECRWILPDQAGDLGGRVSKTQIGAAEAINFLYCNRAGKPIESGLDWRKRNKRATKSNCSNEIGVLELPWFQIFNAARCYGVNLRDAVCCSPSVKLRVPDRTRSNGITKAHTTERPPSGGRFFNDACSILTTLVLLIGVGYGVQDALLDQNLSGEYRPVSRPGLREMPSAAPLSKIGKARDFNIPPTPTGLPRAPDSAGTQLGCRSRRCDRWDGRQPGADTPGRAKHATPNAGLPGVSAALPKQP
ncbi:uncharacterized protein CIMG_11300 [Coccidioides immitis RS]|uniref:Uncharacterized protein n=1 Tax=Coccidioides immitis (strain RS) TaxID=246410 RepID=A0A0D8JUJ2_COCIM|nr:uncharacterized protein CIMG_11300 [Coccidioides immitis RS]KJF60962.1 hypothetical protein CIMG_11300 [Coccidioides immitis RS]